MNEKIPNSFVNKLKDLSSCWPIFAAIISIILLIIAHFVCGVDFLHSFKQITFQQQQDEIKQQEDMLKNNFTKFHNNLGIQFLYVEQFDAATNEFNQVLNVDKLNQNATRGLFDCNVFREASNKTYNREITRKRLDALLNESPTDPLPYLYLGDFAFSLNNLSSAEYYYKKAIDSNNSVAAAYEGMGNIYILKNDSDNALDMFNKAANLSPWNVKYLNNLANIYSDRKDYPQAQYFYSRTLTLNPNYLLPYYGYIDSLRFSGDLKDLNYALGCQEVLVGLLNNSDITNLTINNIAWTFTNKSGHKALLTNYNMKKQYTYYDTALTSYLLNKEDKAQEYLNKAKDLHLDPDSASKVERVLDLDIENLKEKWPEFRINTTDFRKKGRL